MFPSRRAVRLCIYGVSLSYIFFNIIMRCYLFNIFPYNFITTSPTFLLSFRQYAQICSLYILHNKCTRTDKSKLLYINIKTQRTFITPTLQQITPSIPFNQSNQLTPTNSTTPCILIQFCNKSAIICIIYHTYTGKLHLRNIMEGTRSMHGLCTECLSKGGLNMFESKKTNHCLMCLKEPDVLFNQDPYCASCYIMTISSPSKSEMSSQKGHTRNRSFYRPIDKDEIKSMKKSFLSTSGRLIKKISKLFQDNQEQGQLISYLNKKALALGNLQWDKFVPKATKSSGIIYIFIGKSKIIGAFHNQGVNIEGEASIFDQEAGIFSTQRGKIELEFARVKSDSILYSSKSKTIKFGSPSSLEICFEKTLKVYSELSQDFQCLNSFMYRP